MLNRKLNAYITVISAHRPDNVRKITETIGPATWYVPENELSVYASQGIHAKKDGGSLCSARNNALRDAWLTGVPCIQVSDDIKRILHVFPTKKFELVDFNFAIEAILKEMGASTSKLGGIPPTDNPLNFNPKYKIKRANFIIADLIVVKPCDLFFDEKMSLKEDYDYTLQHIEKFGEVTRVEYVMAQFLHKTNAGGAVAARTAELEQKNIKYLIQKWGHERITINPKRGNEILLKRFRNDPKKSFFLA